MIAPKVGQQVFEPVDRIQSGVHGQDVVESNTLFVAEVAPVLEEQILAPLEGSASGGVAAAEFLVVPARRDRR